MASYTPLPDKSAGDIVTFEEWNQNKDNPEAIFDLLASTTTTITSGTGTYTVPSVPAAVTKWRVVISAYGGGGGGYSVVSGGGGGGGSGAQMINYELIMDPGDEIDYTIGAGAVKNNTGSDTDIEVFPSTTNAQKFRLCGGDPGTVGGVSAPEGGGAGGKAKINAIESNGEAFADNFVEYTGGPLADGVTGGGGELNDYGGYGGPTFAGPGGKGGQDVPQVSPTDGVGYGSGGGGSGDAPAGQGDDGGTGADGALVIRIYALEATL